MFSRMPERWKLVWQAIFVLTVCAAAVLLIILLGGIRRSEDTHRVQFQVEASGGFAKITLEAGSTMISEPTTVTSPWSRTLTLASGTEVYLTASNPTQTGNLTCTISIDKTIWKTQKTTAPKDGVACAGIIP